MWLSANTETKSFGVDDTTLRDRLDWQARQSKARAAGTSALRRVARLAPLPARALTSRRPTASAVLTCLLAFSGVHSRASTVCRSDAKARGRLHARPCRVQNDDAQPIGQRGERRRRERSVRGLVAVSQAYQQLHERRHQVEERLRSGAGTGELAD
jgi:hypothetical protein